MTFLAIIYLACAIAVGFGCFFYTELPKVYRGVLGAVALVQLLMLLMTLVAAP